MRLIEKIILPVTELERQRPTEVRSHFFELYDTHFRWFVDMTADMPAGEEEEEEEFEPTDVYFDEVYKRFYLVGVSLVRVNTPERWKIEIGIRGQESVKVYFKTKAAADLVHSKVLAYLLNTSE